MLLEFILVLQILKFLDNIVQRTNIKGEIYIHGSFNVNPVDVVIKYRDCAKKFFIFSNRSNWLE